MPVRHQFSLNTGAKNTRGMAAVLAGKFPKGILTNAFGGSFPVNFPSPPDFSEVSMAIKNSTSTEPAHPTQLNIDAIVKLEHEALHRRTIAERVSDAVAKFIGSVSFLMLQVLLALIWSAINLNVIPGVKPFDPFPFGILALVISSESVLLTIFVLISQNRMARQADRRSHLDLQVGMLAEQELTAMLQMQHKICQRLGIEGGSTAQELKSFSDATDVSKLASELEDKLPDL
jgi:uncharacterized membrane protein